MTDHIATGEPLTEGSRVATVSASSDTAVGVCIFLTVNDLRELGIPVSAGEIEYSIDSRTDQIAVHEHGAEGEDA